MNSVGNKLATALIWFMSRLARPWVGIPVAVLAVLFPWLGVALLLGFLGVFLIGFTANTATSSIGTMFALSAVLLGGVGSVISLILTLVGFLIR